MNISHYYNIFNNIFWSNFSLTHTKFAYNYIQLHSSLLMANDMIQYWAVLVIFLSPIHNGLVGWNRISVLYHALRVGIFSSHSNPKFWSQDKDCLKFFYLSKNKKMSRAKRGKTDHLERSYSPAGMESLTTLLMFAELFEQFSAIFYQFSVAKIPGWIKATDK